MTPEEIKAARKSLGLTQQQLADRLGVAQPRVAAWEAGVNSPPPYMSLVFEGLQCQGLKETIKQLERWPELLARAANGAAELADIFQQLETELKAILGRET